MNIFNFTVPPMLYYIVSGLHSFSPGHYHMSRHNIKVFDLLVVKQGCLYMNEGGLTFQIRAGQALLLRPDSHHFSTDSCKEPTSYYWLHFQTVGDWTLSRLRLQHQRQNTPERSILFILTNLIYALLPYSCPNIPLCYNRPRWKNCSRS